MKTPSNQILRSNLVLLMNRQETTFAQIDRAYIRETSLVSGRHLRTIVGGEGRNCTLQTLDHMSEFFKVRPQDLISHDAEDTVESESFVDLMLEDLIQLYLSATKEGKELLVNTAKMVPKTKKLKM